MIRLLFRSVLILACAAASHAPRAQGGPGLVRVAEPSLARVAGPSAGSGARTSRAALPRSTARFDEITITQNESLELTPNTGITCSSPPTSVYRLFDLGAYDLAGSVLSVTRVGVGLDIVQTPASLAVNLYTLSGTFVEANLTLVGSATFDIVPDDALSVHEVAVTGEFEPSDQMVVEMVNTTGVLPWGGNAAGQSGDTYLRAPAAVCGIPEPTSLTEGLGGAFANKRWVLTVTGDLLPAEGPVLIVSETGLDFGASPLATPPPAETVSLTNRGTETVVISSVSTASPTPFVVDLTGTDLSLDPGESTTFSVEYAPSVGGVYADTITVTSNAVNSLAVIPVSGSSFVRSTLPPGNTTGDAVWNRPLNAGTGASGSCDASPVGTAVPYEMREFRIDQAGLYAVSVDAPLFNPFLAIYSGTEVDVTDPCLNLLATVSGRVLNSPTLEPGPYTLVVSGNNNQSFGPYAGSVTGPGGIAFATAGEGGPESLSVGLTAFPNPARGAVQLGLTVDQSQDVAVTLFDMMGRQVALLFEGAVAADQTLDLRLDTSSLPAGVYVVRAVGASVGLVRRVTVVR